jgi:alkylation response protein AidB-like acyl-CoA dehydrogenase
MDLDWNEQQKLLKNSAREFFEKECPSAFVKECERSPEGYSPALWKKMAGLGWMGLLIPEQYGGMGSSLLDLAVIVEEMGRFAVPSPFLNTVVLCGLPIIEAGNEEQKRDLLPKIASGDLVLSLALTEASAEYTADGVQTRADRRGEGYALNGTKLFVEDAQMARYLLCVARSGARIRGENGISLLLVDGTSPGVAMKIGRAHV